MATCPTTIVLYTEDKVHFPIKYALVVAKQLFQYGVKEISQKGDKVYICLSYSPKATTLKRKFGNLPVRYMRAKLENEEDFNILEKIVRRYKYNLLAEETEMAAVGPKRKLAIEEVYSSSSSSSATSTSEEDSDIEEPAAKPLPEPPKKKSRKQPQKKKQATKKPITAAATATKTTTTALPESQSLQPEPSTAAAAAEQLQQQLLLLQQISNEQII